MDWQDIDRSDSDNEMFQMSSARMHDDNSRVRLLSVSDVEDPHERTSPRDAGLPHLQFRQSNASSRRADEKKTRCAVFSILMTGVILIVTINIGIGIKMKNSRTQTPMTPPTETCPEQENHDVKRCPVSFPWHQYRLPQTVFPSHYDIYLHPNLTHENYTGKVDISIDVRNETDTIVLHSKELDLKSIQVFKNSQKKDSESSLLENHYVLCEELEFLAIILHEKLLPTEQYTIHIDFNADLGKSMRGFYHSKYRTWSGDNRTIATTQFESTDARSAFPCFDEPAFKATFSLSIVRDDDLIALSNMPVEKTENVGTNLRLDRFQKSVPMSTYLVAFIVCDFANVSNTIQLKNGEVRVSVYAPTDKINTAPFALNVSCDVLRFYEKAFGIPYPLPKLDLIAIPDFEAGAMENWGLVTYREVVILWDENSSSISDQELVALVIAHELAHQWFGNLVTMKWWNDLWLNEGFASFMEYYGVDGIRPSWHRMEQFYSEHVVDAMSTDESEYTHPITVPVNSKVQIEEVFDGISYSKGGSIIAMMINYLGADAFLKGVSDYLKAFSYKNAANQDLVKSVAARSNSNEQKNNVLDMLQSWTQEPGFPIVNVSVEGNYISLSQMRYLLSVKNDETPICSQPEKNPLWHIPVSYITDSSDSKKWIFFRNKTKRIQLEIKESKWIVFNVERGGYYVVNYDLNLIKKLTVQLKKDHKVFSALDRSGILYNVAKSAKAGFVSYDKLLDLLSYLESEDDYSPLSTGTDILLGILTTLKLQFETASYNKMCAFTKRLYGRLYAKFGWPDRSTSDPNMNHLDVKVRKLAVSLMCYAGDKQCNKKALDLFQAWKENATGIHPDYKRIVYSAAIRLGPSEYWEFMWKKYSTDLKLDSQEKSKLLSALCHTNDEKKIVRLLDEAMAGESIRHQNTRSVFSHLQSTRIGSMIAWKYMRSNWNALIEIYPMGSFAVQSLVGIFSSSMDEADIAAAEKFVSVNNMSGVRFVKRALDKAKLKVHWIRNYQPQVTQWLADNVNEA